MSAEETLNLGGNTDLIRPKLQMQFRAFFHDRKCVGRLLTVQDRKKLTKGIFYMNEIHGNKLDVRGSQRRNEVRYENF